MSDEIWPRTGLANGDGTSLTRLSLSTTPHRKSLTRLTRLPHITRYPIFASVHQSTVCISTYYTCQLGSSLQLPASASYTSLPSVGLTALRLWIPVVLLLLILIDLPDTDVSTHCLSASLVRFINAQPRRAKLCVASHTHLCTRASKRPPDTSRTRTQTPSSGKHGDRARNDAGQWYLRVPSDAGLRRLRAQLWRPQHQQCYLRQRRLWCWYRYRKHTAVQRATAR